ncbi:MAG: DUF5665 domain-containing protein [Selenomonadales bacterium]|nr:DUF5665 domain-containing protein [Selenomonadales bacterium]MDY3740583.1 DUF5665 domain-containing protein [Selenomonadaceae bacterium]MEE1362447.1 DUF5665 domain-containing protein [Selenomonadaceae bacterium]
MGNKMQITDKVREFLKMDFLEELDERFKSLDERFEKFLNGGNDNSLANVSIEELDGNVKQLNLVMRQYFELLRNKRRLFVMNFFVGLVRGVGFTVGATAVFTMLIYLLGLVVDMNLPIISEWVADFINMVESSKNAK